MDLPMLLRVGPGFFESLSALKRMAVAPAPKRRSPSPSLVKQQ
jgi:hypothetical protein